MASRTPVTGRRKAGRPKGKLGAESREEIIVAALHVAASGGLERLTIQSVAAAAGTSKTSVLHHFGSREGLLEALIERSIGAFADNIADANSPDLLALADNAMVRFFHPSYRERSSVTNQLLTLGMYDAQAATRARQAWARRIHAVERTLGAVPGALRHSTAERIVIAAQGATTLWLTSGERDGKRYRDLAATTVRIIIEHATGTIGRPKSEPTVPRTRVGVGSKSSRTARR